MLRRAVLIVAALNCAYGLFECVVALRIGSVSLFADSVDFFEDTSVNLLIFLGLAWSLQARARLGMLLAGLLLVPAAATVWTGVEKLLNPAPPDPVSLSLTGLGALVVNLTCAVILARFREHSGSLTRAAFLSARNDAYANLAIIGAGLVTAYIWPSIWPDLLVGIGVALLNADAAREVWEAAREEHKTAKS
ncbi:cation transporter [Dongia sp.]|uniref:cation transporter n=1 Tax=Dongia sp. TaxID=1977262 RepID=UPI003752E1A1